METRGYKIKTQSQMFLFEISDLDINTFSLIYGCDLSTDAPIHEYKHYMKQ